MGRKKKSTRVNVVGIDPGTKCGWSILSIGPDGGDVKLEGYGVFDLSVKNYEGGGIQMIRLDEKLSVVIEQFKPKVVVYEKVHRHGEHDGIETAHSYGRVQGKIMEICERLKTPYTVIGTKKARKFAVGNGNADKEKTMKVLSEKFDAKFLNYDESDAVAIGIGFINMMGWGDEA